MLRQNQVFESLPRTNRAGQATRADPAVLAEIFRNRCKELCEQVGRDSCFSKTLEVMDTYISAKKVLRTVDDLHWATKKLRLKRGLSALMHAQAQLDAEAENGITLVREAFQRHLNEGHLDESEIPSLEKSTTRPNSCADDKDEGGAIGGPDDFTTSDVFFVPFPEQVDDLMHISQISPEIFARISSSLRQVVCHTPDWVSCFCCLSGRPCLEVAIRISQSD